MKTSHLADIQRANTNYDRVYEARVNTGRRAGGDYSSIEFKCVCQMRPQ